MPSNLVKTFKKFQKYKWDSYTLWSDFIEMSALSISIPVDIKQRTRRSKRYLEISNKYTKEELGIFADMLGSLVLDLEENPRDVLGEVFMELELGNKWKGQFFTPYNLAYLMAEQTISKESVEGAAKDKGYFTVIDEACGGGVTLMAAFNLVHDMGFNPQNIMVIEGRDIDARSCHMSYVQLSLLGANAVIRQRDALDSLDTPDDEIWFTPFYLMGGWKYRTRVGKLEKDLRTVTDDDGHVSFLVSEVS